MRYRRALLLVELGGDARPAVSALRRVAPELAHVVVVAWMPAPAFAWRAVEGAPETHDDAEASLEALRAAAAETAPSARVQLVPELGSEALSQICLAERVELLVVGSPSLRSASVLYEVRRRRPLPILFARKDLSTGPVGQVVCFAVGRRARASVRTFLRDHAEPSMHVTLLGPEAPAREDVASLLELTGVAASVEGSPPSGASSLRRWVEQWRPTRPVHLLVLAQVPAFVLLGARWPAPVLLLPPLAAPRKLERRIDVADLADGGGPLRARVDHLVAVGDLSPVPDQPIAFVSAGRVVATVGTRAGAAELPAGLEASALGVYRVGERAADDPLAAVEQRVAVIRPGAAPLILFDSEISDELLRALSELAGPPAPELLAVRLRPIRSSRSIRERLRVIGLPPRVLDARAVIDEGDALDVSEAVDPVRLARVAAKLRDAGFPVAAIVHRSPIQPLVRGFATLSEPELTGAGLPAAGAFSASRRAEGEAALPTGRVHGNRVELELDNAKALRWLLDAIASASASVHLQVYMALDDDVGAPVEAALAKAGARGVTVRILVDSLHGLHGSFGAHNPLLVRLAARPGVELRASRPITELPSLADLKQRDHRKLVVVDGRVALVGGRNLSHEYYSAFEDARLTAETTWREVPWLDAGARVEGPAVAAVATSFREAWTEAGGAPFEIATPPPAGPSSARVVVHRGLRDARTLEAYLELVETARSHVYAVNGFPLALELQHALLRAIRRGVRVRALAGHVTPTHGGEPFKGPWATARTAATELVHSRLDPIVAAGGEAYLFALQDLPGWSPGLGVVHPHVHAKVMSADGLRCAVGSANLDITSAYWESELMLVVEDPEVVRGLESRIDQLMVGSIRMKGDDPEWKELARRRAWMRHWPGVLSV